MLNLLISHIARCYVSTSDSAIYDRFFPFTIRFIFRGFFQVLLLVFISLSRMLTLHLFGLGAVKNFVKLLKSSNDLAAGYQVLLIISILIFLGVSISVSQWRHLGPFLYLYPVCNHKVLQFSHRYLGFILLFWKRSDEERILFTMLLSTISCNSARSRHLQWNLSVVITSDTLLGFGNEWASQIIEIYVLKAYVRAVWTLIEFESSKVFSITDQIRVNKDP